MTKTSCSQLGHHHNSIHIIERKDREMGGGRGGGKDRDGKEEGVEGRIERWGGGRGGGKDREVGRRKG